MTGAGGDHDGSPILVCGLGAFGQAVLCRLLPFDVALQVLDLRPPDWRTPGLQEALQPRLTLGDMRRPHVLRQAGVEQARSVLLLSSDSGSNIEAALQVRLLNPTAEIVIRSGSDLQQLGSLLEVRYRVGAGDTLVGRTVSRLDHGYGLNVLSLMRQGDLRPRTMPSPGTVVWEGDQLVVLASLPALRRVEQGMIRPPALVITIELPECRSPEQVFTLQQILARQLGLSPAEAAMLVKGPPCLRLPVDPDCGALLVRDLQHQAIRARLQPVNATPP